MSTIPKILKEISNPPKHLYCLGRDLEENFSGVAIVGTRKASALGLATAKAISYELASLGIPIISGLASGIDSASHLGALEAHGVTVAVLGGGLDKIYPPENCHLAQKIIDSHKGSLLSEYEDGTPYFKNQFLERNRIVAGLAIAVIVIEAPFKSGAINTAGLAASFGREVFVFPGPTNHKNYEGSHKLIRDGARLVTRTQDILDDLGLSLEIKKPRTENLPKESAIIINALNDAASPLSVDKIILLTKLEPQTALASLTSLCLEGIIAESNEGYIIKQ